MNKDFRLAYDVIDKVFREGAYSNILLNEVLYISDNKALVTKLVYGVLEKNITLEYYLSKVISYKPQNKVYNILKLGLYMLQYMDSIKPYTVCNEMVELCGIINKKAQKAFVNATLKKCVQYKFDLPLDKKEKLMVEYSIPLWLVKAYFKQYGEEIAEKIIKHEPTTLEHIRHNKNLLSVEELENKLKNNNINYKKSTVGGYFVKNNQFITELFNEGLITFQSPSSMLVCKSCDVKDNYKILDLCSAPGGKSVYLSELANNLDIISCDIYPQRVEKIIEYSTRMRSNGIKTEVMDATVFKADYKEKFDLVLADVPCSGLGVAHKKADIYLNKSMEDINALSEVQYKILNNAIEYAKPNGIIIYSTCTTLREENYNVIGKTLKFRNDVKLEKMNIGIDNDGYIQLLPFENNLDGFFIARLRKC